jgi:hypothetical protein
MKYVRMPIERESPEEFSRRPNCSAAARAFAAHCARNWPPSDLRETALKKGNYSNGKL